ncbi:MAG: HAMP domain-containing protein, partial [Gammaproteobacteria bacterium]
MQFACAGAACWRTIVAARLEPTELSLRPRLFHKLFAAIVIACFASIVLFGAVAHWSMKRSFQRYLHEERAERMETLAGTLVAQYDAEHGFAHLRDDRRAWRRLLRTLRTEREAAPAEEHDSAPAPRRPDTGFLLARHITLYDIERRIIAGRLPFAAATTTTPVVVDGHIVGWLGAPSLERPAEGRERRFAQRQLQLLLIAALVAGVLAIPVAWWLARRLVQPIRRLGAGARALAEGRFDARVPVAGGDELGQLAQDFNLLARALEENESARRRWIADVSHELRTPLSILAGEIEAARDGVRPLDMRLVESLEAESRRLAQLVEDLYLLARADIGALDFEFAPVPLDALVSAAVERFAHRLAAA